MIHCDVFMHWDVRTVRALDKSYFSQVDIVLGAVTWPNDQDIAPETLLAGLRPISTDKGA
ncbi:Protein of unknown function DUF2442 [Leptonema illini DSM 21528]|uniref:DUF2442 domain-containing protein n=1 Tax=Leptonema illini DSM 21528 TaxID=929563 RepID=H2CEG7_9LEPT|nr:Protein of unknown function DUF2442 [Leptonema illini DSM 21528]